MIHQLLISLLLCFTVIGLVVVVLWWSTLYTDRVAKKAIQQALHKKGYKLVEMEDSDNTFIISPVKTKWSGFIRYKNGGPMEKTCYYNITYTDAQQSFTTIAAVYISPLSERQVFFQQLGKKKAVVP